MDSSKISAVNQLVYQRFPELQGIKPRVQKLDQNSLLTYQKTSVLPDGKSLHRSVRVVVNEHGEVLKISTSR